MIQIIGPQLNQWDDGRSISVSGSNATHVHMANRGDSHAVIMELVDGETKIPNYLLQSGKDLCIYLVLDKVTQESKTFPVRKRERPQDYVYSDDKRNYIYELITDAQEATEAANLAAKSANDAADKASKTADALTFIDDAKGTEIHLDKAVDQGFLGFRIFGKTTQDGVPTPDAPVELESVGDSGSITVDVAGDHDAQSMTIATPNGLPGIPVASGGNYTDATGQQWICDEIDFARGVHIQRIHKYPITGNEHITQGSYKWQRDGMFSVYLSDILPEGAYLLNTIGACLSTHGTPNEWEWMSSNSLNNVGFRGRIIYLSLENDSLGILDGDSDDTKLSKTRSYLKAQNTNGQPVIVYYPLATPIETPLSEEELAAYAALHTYRGNTIISNDATAHMAMDYVMDAKKYIDRLIGSGGSGGAAPSRLASVTLKASAWTGKDSLYSQVVSIQGVTEYSKVDLLPSVEQLAIFHNKDVAFVTENEDGVVTVYAIGDKPALDYTMQVSITEVIV